MRSLIRAIAPALALFQTAAAMEQPRAFPVAERPVLEDRYPDRVTQFPGGISSYADVTYSTLPGYRPLIVDIYAPDDTGAPKPLIVYIHGGGWVSGHTRHSGALGDFPGVLASLAAEGFVVASLEYRLSGEASFPAQLQDVRAALRFFKANAEKFSIDPERTAVWGGSAGGHLAALAAMTCGDASLDAEGVESAPGGECVQAAAIWYGVFDFAALSAGREGGTDSIAGRFLGCGATCGSEDYDRASPAAYIDAGDPPVLLIHGVNDSVVPAAQSHLAEKKLKAAGVPVEAIYIDGADHSFIGKNADKTRKATLDAMNATFDFFHDVLKGEAQ